MTGMGSLCMSFASRGTGEEPGQGLVSKQEGRWRRYRKESSLARRDLPETTPNPVPHVLACSSPESSPTSAQKRVLGEGEKADSALCRGSSGVNLRYSSKAHIQTLEHSEWKVSLGYTSRWITSEPEHLTVPGLLAGSGWQRSGSILSHPCSWFIIHGQWVRLVG